MNEREKELWQGGIWEQEKPEYPAPPPVIVPQISAYQPGEPLEKQQKLSIGALLGFGGFLTLILTIVCLSVVIGVQNHEGLKLDPPAIPDIFGGFETEKGGTSQTKVTLPPTIRSAPLGTGVKLELKTGANTLTPQEIYQRNEESIVFIQAKSLSKYATGTGVLMTSDGYIITNAHVIDEASSATVTLHNNLEFDARLVGYNLVQDLAVLKIDAEDLTPAEFGDSDLLSVGDPSYAIGNPLGSEYRSTFTDGMVSAVDRVLQVDDNSLIFVQTTAAINSGNSGGALLNEFGQVVGITTIKIMSEEDTIEGMGFAIPTKRVKQVVERLIEGEEILEASIGITVMQVTEPVNGLKVVSVTEESNVEKAGMETGDIIVEANGRQIHAIADLNLVKGYLFVGDTVDYVVYREEEEVSFSAELESFDLE